MFQYYSKIALLSLRKSPVLSALIIVALALGIALSMTSLNIYYLMSSDPVPHKSDRLFTVQLDSYGTGTSYQYSSDGLQHQITYQDAINLAKNDIPVRQSRMLRSGFAVKSPLSEVAPFLEIARFCDHDFFKMFDFEFIHGNVWDRSVDENGNYDVILSASMSEKIFGEENSVGKTIELSGKIYTVIGIVKDYRPTPFFYDLNTGHYNQAEKIFVPFSLIPKNETRGWGNYVGWKDEYLDTHAKVLQGEGFWVQYWLELEEPQQRAQYQDFLANYIQEQKRFGRFEKEHAQGKIRNVTEWLQYNDVVSEDNRILVGLGFLFLLACIINAIGLLLAKLLRSAPEAGIRRALGASKKDLFTQYSIEILIIGLLGGILGLLLTLLGLQGLKSIFSAYEKLTELNLTMASLIFFVSIFSAVLAGLIPIFRICQTQPSIYLKTQ